MLGLSRRPPVVLVVLWGLGGLAPAVAAQCKFTVTSKHCYAPPDVTMAPANGVPHDVHELTIFLPLVPPPPDAPTNGMGMPLYPTVLYSPAGAFGEGVSTEQESVGNLYGEMPPLAVIGRGAPAGSNLRVLVKPGQQPAPTTELAPLCGFLDTALLRGWAVVTAGTTGWNSWPTCSQDNDCNECQNLGTTNPGCGATAGCRDTNLWIDPSSPDWDDFNEFSGEKEFTWARQWIGEHGADHLLDTNRVVVCGTSTGAIYASFLAFNENLAWEPPFSSQAQQDTRVAAMVAFEPNTWVKALKSSSPGVHWPSSTDPLDVCGPTGVLCAQGGTCVNRRALSTITTAPGLVEASSVSRWVRDFDPSLGPDMEPVEVPVPVFIASGDSGATTGFARDANTTAFEEDYYRLGFSLPPGCPVGTSTNPDLIPGARVLEYTSGSDELRLHDSWFAVGLRVDLMLEDALSGETVHALRSRLYLQEGQSWSFLPPCFSTTASAPTSADEVALLDGTFLDYGTLEGGPTSIDNVALAPDVVTWMEAAIGVQRGAGVVHRNPPLVGGTPPPGPCTPSAGIGSVANPNPDVFRATTAWTDLPVLVEVDLNGTGYDEALVLFFTAPYDPCHEFVLGGGQVVLCDLATVQDFNTGWQEADPDGVVRFTLGGGSPAGLAFCTQAILRDTTGSQSFALTNAADLTIQYMP